MILPKYTCLFAHFSPKGNVSEYVYTYLDHLASLQVQIIFISNSRINDGDRLRLKKNPGLTEIYERENRGNDFGAWKWYFANHALPPDTDHILLTNDSIFGPISNLAEVFDSMSGQPDLDFWGLTDSWQGQWHLQSYFVSLAKCVFTSDIFRKVLLQDFENFPKKDIIEKGEILLTTALVKAGFRAKAYIPYKDMDPECDPQTSVNPTHFFYEKLIHKFKFPFVKKELVLQNPENLPGIQTLFKYIDKHTNYPISNILHALTDLYEQPADDLRNSPSVSVICHMYYPSSIYYFLLKLSVLKKIRATFIFNLSTLLFHDVYFKEVLGRSFPGSITLHSPSKGRDIGGKLCGIDALLRLDIPSGYTLILHDKLSPHVPTGKAWRDKLFRNFEEKNIPSILSAFERSPSIGVITSAEFISNEYDPDTNSFTCTSRQNLLDYMHDFDLTLSDYNFAAGTIFWIRTGILRKFFQTFPPLQIREGLESGNALDFTRGTNIHAWERLFSFIAISQGFKIKGV